MSRVLHITSNESGGAGRAARRLHDGLLDLSWDSWMVTGRRTAGARRPGAPMRSTTLVDAARPMLPGPVAAVESQLPRLVNVTGDVRVPFRSSRRVVDAPLFRDASVVHLHLLHGNFFDYRVLPEWAARKPLIWTLHDMWPLTGHCAFSYDCERWVHGCHHCPLYSPEGRPLDDIPQTPHDGTRGGWRRKRRTYEATPLTVVAPSRWLYERAARSILMTHPRSAVHHIPYGLDTDVYRPGSRATARGLLGIPEDRRVVLFGAHAVTQERKGAGHLREALSLLGVDLDRLYVLSFGIGESPEGAERVESRALGAFADEHLQALAYAAADVVAVPSLADNQPLIALEAMACGVPVVAYGSGGIPEVVAHGETGYCARPGDPRDLAAALRSVLASPDERERMGRAARERAVREHGLRLQAERYASLYEDAGRRLGPGASVGAAPGLARGPEAGRPAGSAA